MNELKKKLIDRATTTHRRIFPPTMCSSLEDCFTVEGRALLFWFNTEDQSTHLLVEDLK